MDNSQHFDMDALNELIAVMGDGYPTLIETFFTGSQKRIDTIEKAILESDSTVVRKEAHTFKGTAGNLAATRLYALCQHLVGKALAHEIVACEELLDEIIEEFARVKKILQTTLEP